MKTLPKNWMRPRKHIEKDLKFWVVFITVKKNRPVECIIQKYSEISSRLRSKILTQNKYKRKEKKLCAKRLHCHAADITHKKLAFDVWIYLGSENLIGNHLQLFNFTLYACIVFLNSNIERGKYLLLLYPTYF